MTYKQQMADLANAYWQARWAHNEAEAKRIYDSMSDVQPDALPEWVDPVLVTIADRLGMNERDERTDLAGIPWVCRGHWPADDAGYGIDRFLGEGWVEPDGWRNGFTAVWLNDDRHAIVTFCEGDITIDIYPTADAYRAGTGSAAAFYRRQAQ